MVLIDTAEKGAVDEIFGRSFDRWTQSRLFINEFTSRDLEFLRFIRLLAQSIMTRLDETAND